MSQLSGEGVQSRGSGRLIWFFSTSLSLSTSYLPVLLNVQKKKNSRGGIAEETHGKMSSEIKRTMAFYDLKPSPSNAWFMWKNSGAKRSTYTEEHYHQSRVPTGAVYLRWAKIIRIYNCVEIWTLLSVSGTKSRAILMSVWKMWSYFWPLFSTVLFESQTNTVAALSHTKKFHTT